MSEDNIERGRSGDAASVLSSILSNPDALSKMSEIIAKHTNKENRDNSPPSEDIRDEIPDSSSNFEENAGGVQKDSTTSQIEKKQENTSNSRDILSLFSSLGDNKDHSNDKQTALLLAIRPYLSTRRQELLDTMMRMGKISKIFMDIK